MAGAGETADRAATSIHIDELEFELPREFDIIDITAAVGRVVQDSGVRDGAVTLFVPGATGALTCLEYEPGVLEDFRAAIERLAPRDMAYQHNVYHSDGNGHSHVRAGLLGPSLAVPVLSGSMTLGVWQQLVLVNFDNRGRTRKVVVQVVGA